MNRIEKMTLFCWLTNYMWVGLNFFWQHTKYGFVDINKVKWKLTGGLKWYITFRARRTPKDFDTFEAIVHTTKFRRQVGGIRIKRRGSPWYDGSLAELVK
jgi:hypothetical protein